MWPTPKQLEEAARYYRTQDELMEKYRGFTPTTFWAIPPKKETS